MTTQTFDPIAAPANSNKKLWAAIAVLGVAVLAMGATLIRIQSQPVEPRMAMADAAGAASAASAASAPLAAASEVIITETAMPAASAAPAAITTTPAVKPESSKQNKPLAHTNKAQAATTKEVTQAPKSTPAAAPVPLPLPADEPAVARTPEPVKPICVNCGTVERVTAIEQEGQGSGLGAIAGGVLGAVVGNQVGRGDGRKLATVIGAVGGGLAGNSVEKNMKKTTHYQVLVRMEDGSIRTLEQSTAPMIGNQVVIDGNTLHPARRERDQPIQ